MAIFHCYVSSPEGKIVKCEKHDHGDHRRQAADVKVMEPQAFQPGLYGDDFLAQSLLGYTRKK